MAGDSLPYRFGCNTNVILLTIIMRLRCRLFAIWIVFKYIMRFLFKDIYQTDMKIIFYFKLKKKSLSLFLSTNLLRKYYFVVMYTSQNKRHSY